MKKIKIYFILAFLITSPLFCSERSFQNTLANIKTKAQSITSAFFSRQELAKQSIKTSQKICPTPIKNITSYVTATPMSIIKKATSVLKRPSFHIPVSMAIIAYLRNENLQDKVALTKLKTQECINKNIFNIKAALTTDENALFKLQMERLFTLMVESEQSENAHASQYYLQKLNNNIRKDLQIILQKNDLPSLRHISIVSTEIKEAFGRSHFIHSKNPSLLKLLLHKEEIIPLTKTDVQNTIITALIKEKESLLKDEISYYHGRRREYDFPTQLYSFLEYLTINKKTNNEFLLTHIKKLATNLTEEKKKRKKIIKYGNSYPGNENRQDLLFLNHFIFGNTTNLNSNSIYNMLHNYNEGHITINAKDIFTMFDMEKYYPKYAKKLDSLIKNYNMVNDMGQLLHISITPEKEKKSVYETDGYGQKHSTYSAKFLSPIDQTEFALINTFDKYGGLNEHGMKISVLDPADHDPASLKKKIACNKERDELFAAIEADYKAMMAQNTNVINAQA